MKRLRLLYLRLIHSGIYKGLTPDRAYSIRQHNILSIFVSISIFPGVLFLLFEFPDKNYWVPPFILGASFSCSILFNRMRKFMFSRIWLVIWGCISVLWCNWLIGVQVGVLFLILLTLMQMIVLLQNERKSIFLATAIGVTMVGLGGFLYDVYYEPQLVLNAQQQFSANLIVWVVGISNMIFFSLFHVVQHKLNNMHIREKNEQILWQVDVLKQKNQELDKVIRVMSHDLRAPLNSLTGLTKLLKEETNPEMRNQLLKFQEESIAKLDKFILDILQMSKVQRQEKVIDTFDLTELIHSTVETLQFSNLGFEIDIVQKHTGPKQLNFDRSRLKIILNNLISNAIFYSKSIDESLIEINSEISATKFSISVWDNGIGISEVDIQRIFDLFYRGNTKREGTGIGLSMVKETVEKLGGTISVTSKEGEFTCFMVEFPL